MKFAAQRFYAHYNPWITMMNLAHKTICYSAPCRKAEYGDECVCLFVRMYISGTTRSSFTGVSVRVANGHGSVLLWRLCDINQSINQSIFISGSEPIKQ